MGRPSGGGGRTRERESKHDPLAAGSTRRRADRAARAGALACCCCRRRRHPSVFVGPPARSLASSRSLAGAASGPAGEGGRARGSLSRFRRLALKCAANGGGGAASASARWLRPDAHKRIHTSAASKGSQRVERASRSLIWLPLALELPWLPLLLARGGAGAPVSQSVGWLVGWAGGKAGWRLAGCGAEVRAATVCTFVPARLGSSRRKVSGKAKQTNWLTRE